MATKYTLTHTSNGREIATGRTEKQAVTLARANGESGVSIVGTDGVSYMTRGLRSLVPVGHVASVATAAEAERYASAMERDAARAIELRTAPSADYYDDDAAIEDLGLGTADGGRWPRR